MKNKNNLFYRITLLTMALIPLLFLAVLLIPTKTYAVLQLEPAYSVLKNTNDGTGEQVKIIWKQLIDIVNYFVIAILIFVAFAQILRLNVSTYGIKKILPALILAIIGANFSFLFCRLLVDAANVVMSLFWKGPQPDTLYHSMSGVPWANPNTWAKNHGVALKDANLGQIFWFMFAQIFVMIGGVMLLVLSYLFFIRLWLIYFLVALSPLAFMATVLPQTKTVFTQWMSNFAKWVFLPVVSIFWIWLGNKWVSVAYLAQSNDYVMTYVFAGVCYYLAITTPFKMGGAVMSAWGNLGKRLTGKPASWAWGKAKTKWVDPWIKQRKDKIASWYFDQGGQGHSKFNPLGMIARRGSRVGYEREMSAKKVEGKLNTLRREALGGKEYMGKDGKMHPKFLSRERQLKYAKEADAINADFGESEWMEKHLQNLYTLTPEGQAIGGSDAARRSLAYRLRMTTADQDAKYVEEVTTSEAFGDEENNSYLKNTSFGIVKDDLHWKNMKDIYVESKSRLERMGSMAALKLSNDKEKIDFQPAASLGLLKAEHDKWKGVSEKLRMEGKEGTEEFATAVQRMDKVARVFDRAVTRIEKDKGLFKNGKLSSDAITLRKVLTDQNGGYIGKDINRAQSLEKLWGFSHLPEETKKMFYSRLRKSIGIIAKEEETSEAGKRSNAESAERVFERFETELHNILSDEVTEWDNNYKDAWAAIKNSLVTAQDENAPLIYEKFLKGYKDAFEQAETKEGKLAAIEKLGIASTESFRAALISPRNIADATKSAAAEMIQKAQEEKGTETLSEDEVNEIVTNQYADEGFRTKVGAFLQKRLATVTRQKERSISEMVDINFDEHGGIGVDFKHKNDERAAELVDLLHSAGNVMIRHNFRDQLNGAGQGKMGIVAGIKKSLPVGSKEAGTYYININDIKVQ